MKLKHSAGFAAAGVLAMALTACSSGSDSGDDAAESGDGAISGDITVLTNRTDLIDTTFQDYKNTFESEYPDVNVEFEGITDYEGDVSIRLNTQDFGDVLLIPNTVSKDQLPNFFAPLGSVDEVSETYRFVSEQAYEDQAYGVAITGNAQGYVINKKVWEEAGITEAPTTPEEFVDALQAIADSTDATPYYTNYADGWPLSQWQGNRGVIAGPETEQILADTDEPWTEGEEQYAIDSLLYDVVDAGLSEDDPTTTNWEESKTLLGSGEVATMVLGSWAVTQVQDAAEAAGGSPDDIAYWPMPFQVDGSFHSTIGGDYKNAVSKYSENPEAARAWVDWFAQESGYAESQGGLAPTVEGELPSTLSEFESLGVEFVEIDPAPAGEETALSDIYDTAEIDLWGNVYRQKMIDTARGAADGDKASYFDSLNERWSAARAEVG
ncbi:ABC-type glycerol-3-phosphate transport system, substrate-binding protein [Paraoerskovia marina]|uniref:ABC-type glycerol-3-phosphate transport system, substrate-binding protein n=1 Tax=Paraoerskovia marina TaxID=545619 RepID=A0A1H1MMT0_9CELL|nr:ABC transporter substrate-binding protein [Paraoerskovia marina]SDR88046.1 ABC-type glycerol-3-phosphate transport system, substrate-binding protein [Paraoerskovia marina]